jgi:hypothetical protein
MKVAPTWLRHVQAHVQYTSKALPCLRIRAAALALHRRPSRLQLFIFQARNRINEGRLLLIDEFLEL